jgi:UDPglucose 6-dehydrogenase
LYKEGAILKVYDPAAHETSQVYFEGKVQYKDNPYQALEGAEALLLLTEWREFREPDFDRVKQLMKTPLIFDGRNQYSKKAMKQLGFTHYAIGVN